MSHIPKLVELNIEIHPDGTLHVTPSGTEGAECMDLLKFLQDMDGARTLKVETNDDYKKGEGVLLIPFVTVGEETNG